MLNDQQLRADIEAIALEGIRIVSGTKRPFHTQNSVKIELTNNPSYNFPIISGEVLDGANFEPIVDATVVIKYKGKILESIDKSWQNPVKTCSSTKGKFNFWIKPFDCSFIQRTTLKYDSISYQKQ